MHRLNERFLQLYIPGEDLIVDEGIMGTKCRTKLGRHNPRKPHPNDIRVFSLADASSAYCLRFLIDTASAPPVADLFATDQSFSARVVRHLLQPFEKSQRLLVLDRLFMSISLATDLLHCGIYPLGTCSTHRRGFPSDLKSNLPRARGEFTFVCKDGLTVTAWRDQSVVCCVSSSFEPPTSSSALIVNRRSGGSVLHLPCPPSIVKYNQVKGGVDRNNQMVEAFSTYRKGKRWWRRVWSWLLDTTIVNCWIVWRDHAERKARIPTHAAFLDKLAHQLIADFTCRERHAAHLDPDYVPNASCDESDEEQGESETNSEDE